MTTYELSRTVRSYLAPGADLDRILRQPKANTFAGWPSPVGLGIYVELVVHCRHEADPRSGFVVDIADVDEAVRRAALPIIAEALAGGARAKTDRVLGRIVEALGHELAGLHAVTWNLTPHHWLRMELSDMNRVLTSQQFEFAAAHRLHNPGLDDDENLRLYGKCNNPNGHGHNYRLEIVVSRPLGATGDGLSLPALDQLVNEHVVRRFDHTHLNLDTAEFAELIPTVEHITKVCFDLLADPVAASGGRLEEVTVWETAKTCCTYRGSLQGPARTGR